MWVSLKKIADVSVGGWDEDNWLLSFWIPLGAPNLPEIEFSAAGGRPERNRVAFLSEFCLKVVFVRYVLQFWLDLARNFNGNAEAFNLFYRNT